MSESNKLGFYSVLLLVFLLPLFFIPSALIPLGFAKTTLVALVAFVGFAGILVSIFRSGRLQLPSTKLLWGVLVLPAVYIASALASSSSQFSLFGYDFEPGTAGSIALLSMLLLVSVFAFRDRSRLVRVHAALFLSLALVSVFALVNIVTGGKLTLGIFSGAMGNPIGGWVDLATGLATLAVLSVFALEMLTLGRAMSVLVWILFGLSLALMTIISFSSVWAILLGFGLVLLVYFLTVEESTEIEGRHRPGVWAATILTVVSLLFVWNPTFGDNTLSASISSSFGVNNIDVRPTLSRTLGIARSTWETNPLLGSGPNTFDKAWLLNKPAAVNSSVFWNTAFPFGYGFLPTMFVTTGVLGTLAWILFLFFFISLGVKAISKGFEHRSDRFLVVTSFLVSLFLWVALFFYVPSVVVITLTFIFTGIFIASAEATGVIGSREWNLRSSRLARFISTLALIAIVLAVGWLGYNAVKKTISIWHFEKALAASTLPDANADEIEKSLVKAINVSQTDQYWIAFSQIELARANAAANNSSLTDEEKRTAFNDSLSKSIAALQRSIELNPSYSNWVLLGNLYESLVPAPLAVENAYEAALAAYQNAKALNPASPEIPLFLARLEYDHKNVEGARKHIDEALALKNDYADAYFLLSQIEIRENNLAQAIRSAEAGVILTPNNAGVLFELGVLKYSARDYAGTIEAMDLALQISPDYANAKFYRGLALDKLGRKAEAIAVFEDLAVTNPGNETITQAIENLKAGKPALPETPQSNTPPVSGQ